MTRPSNIEEVVALLIDKLRIELEVETTGNRGEYRRQIRATLWLGDVQIDWDEVDLGEMP